MEQVNGVGVPHISHTQQYHEPTTSNIPTIPDNSNFSATVKKPTVPVRVWICIILTIGGLRNI